MATKKAAGRLVERDYASHEDENEAGQRETVLEFDTPWRDVDYIDKDGRRVVRVARLVGSRL